jgi:small GTP-binding protein
MDAERVRFLEDSDTAKIVLLGDVGAGKTSILHQYERKSFSKTVESTVGIACNTISVQTSLGLQQIKIWDTAGEERYRALVPLYARSAAAALIVIDTNCATSVASVPPWIRFVRQNCPGQCLVFIIANKIDLPRLVAWDELTSVAKENELPIIQTTATQYFSVAGLFEQVAEEVAKRARELPTMDFAGNIAIHLPESEKSSCC